LFRRVRELPENEKARLRKLFTELAITLLGTVDETLIQKLLCAGTLTRDGSRLEISPMIELFDFRIYRYGPYDREISRCLREILDVKVREKENDIVILDLEHKCLSRQEIEREIRNICNMLNISEICEDYLDRLHRLAREYNFKVRDLVYELLDLDEDRKILLFDISLRDLLKILGLYPGLSYDEAVREVLGDELVEEVRRYVEEIRRLNIPRELIETEPPP